jgi:hypothetical protein
MGAVPTALDDMVPARAEVNRCTIESIPVLCLDFNEIYKIYLKYSNQPHLVCVVTVSGRRTGGSMGGAA